MALSISPGDAIGCAYARHFHSEWLLVIVPLAVARGREWTEESVHVPAILFGTWINVFTDKQITVTENLFLREAMREFPLCLLTRVED